ncbi:MAG: RluA family pseudouridine synthase [Gammaproteobacteria bacterium]|nr:RluA family pseudouridine synthase [Gammaproteobacteria bacterium]MBT4461921.1 RluA family pseudouridine synthase [Gammaproteobacteria bacterium]MBT4654310.1 RluA family pseudouridine synthase [Gammaproteobacteria bacterium]MBT5116907.1 RluA family pseudouridine synthase [Gammaproteobacteria bacterium]MBT5761215.1 RluA family pseudouridine synthase [Gammaproteobacteria bacterium]
MSDSNHIKVRKIVIPAEQQGQRLDNYLRKILTGVPNSLIYKIIRDGQVRVNSGRVRPLYRLKAKDILRIPPVSVDLTSQTISNFLTRGLKKIILYENDDFMVINKPPGIAVHSGSKIEHDIMSSLKSVDKYKSLSLVHRLDKNTSGCLILAKNYQTASALGKIFMSGAVEKNYISLLSGTLTGDRIAVEHSLTRNKGNASNSVSISEDGTGKVASSYISLLRQYKECCLVNIKIETGRMHQIRVHALSIGQPVCGDTKYGDKEVNKRLREYGLKRMFLHSKNLSFFYKRRHIIEAPQPDDLTLVIDNLKNGL